MSVVRGVDRRDVFRLAAFSLRLRRGLLLSWIPALAVFLALITTGFHNVLSDQASRAAYISSIGSNPATRILFGVLDRNANLGQLLTWSVGSYLCLLSAVMAVLLVAGLHRGAEDTGTAGLLRSTGVGASAALASTLMVLVVAGIALAGAVFAVAGVAAVLIGEMSVGGAAQLAATVGLNTIGSGAVALLVGQFAPDGHRAMRAGLASVVVGFLVRGTAAMYEDARWVNWLTPLGWRSLIDAYAGSSAATTGGRVAVLILICLVLCVTTVLIERRREFGAGVGGNLVSRLVGTRHRRVGGPVSLRALVSGPVAVSWVMVATVMATVFGVVSGEIDTLAGSGGAISGAVAEVFRGDDLLDGFLSFTAVLVGIVLSVAAVQLIVAALGEEHSGLTELQLSTGLGRAVPLWAHTVVAAVAVAVGLTVASAAEGTTATLANPDIGDAAGRAVVTMAGQVGPVVLFAGVAVALVGWAPRRAALAWWPILAAAVVTQFGVMLDLPGWLIDASPFGHTPVFAGEPGQWRPVVLMTTAGVLLTAAGFEGVARRDIG